MPDRGNRLRHRTSMGELLQKLADETGTFETVLAGQRASLDDATAAIQSEAKKFESLVSDTDRQLDLTMANAASRATQLSQCFGRVAEKLKEISENASCTCARLWDSLRDAGVGA